MNKEREEPKSFEGVQAQRDLGANWDVDLSKKLEDYLLKICSGQFHPDSHIDVNFAEAALLLQGSAQVYSKKVEYLHNLVVHALQFLYQKRQEEQSEGTSDQPEQNGSSAVHDNEEDQFWGLDDIPVEARTCLDASTSKDASFYHFVKPPANLIVLEGDCLDTTGDAGELESYLLATNDLYRDFILLDPCDAVEVNDFLKGDGAGKGQSSYRSSSNRKNFQSPAGRSGTARKSSLGKCQNANLNQSPMADCSFRYNTKLGADPPAGGDFDDGHCEFDNDDGYAGPQNNSDLCSDSDDDNNDPWKLLNPHEPGNLEVKPFKRVKASRKNGLNLSKRISISILFPLARFHGTISPELTEIWKAQCNKSERHGKFESASLYKKLRDSLINGGENINWDTSDNVENDDEENGFDGGVPDFEVHDEMPGSTNMDEDLPHHEKHDDGGMYYGTNEAFEHGEPSSQASLEDLCRSHLEALHAKMAETLKQTEMAARVSSWQQKIERNLEEQDSRPPFDIHVYGEKIIEKLSLEEDIEKVMSFADVVKGQEKHDVARSFSALLQLVNNGDVDLDKCGHDGEPMCYTASNPFRIQLLSHDQGRTAPPPKTGDIRCTPEGKRRRKVAATTVSLR